jgi:hypothetical protein
MAQSWDRLHPRLTSRAAREHHDGELPVIEGTLIRLQVLRDVDLEDGRAADLEDVWGVENPAGWGPAGLGGAQGVAGGAQGVAVISVIAVRAAL